MEDIVFLRDNSLSLETINDFRTILSRQRKVVLALFVRQRLNSEEEEEVKESYKKREIQEKLADIILLSSFNGNDVSDIKLDATILLAALTKSVKGRSEDLQDAIARELITALRATSENELLCNVLVALSLHCHNHVVRDNLFRLDLMDALLWLYSLTSQDIDITRAILRLLSSILKPKPMEVNEAFNLLPILSATLHSSDPRTISYAATAIGYLFEEEGSYAIMIRDNTIAPTLVQLMMHSSVEVVEAALKAAGNIISGEDRMTQAMIELQVVPSLLWLVDYPSSKVRNEALWSLSNIAAGSHSQIQSLIDAGVVPRIMPFMKDWASESKEEKDRFKETVWTLGNMLKSGSNSQRRYLLNEKVFEAFCPPLRNLTALGEKSQQVVLEGLYRLLCFAQADFVGSKEVISSLFKKEKLRDLLTASKFSIHHQYSRFWMSEVCNLVRKLKLE